MVFACQLKLITRKNNEVLFLNLLCDLFIELTMILEIHGRWILREYVLHSVISLIFDGGHTHLNLVAI